MRAGEPVPRAQLGEHGLQLPDRAVHPFQFGVLEFLLDERRAHIVVTKDSAVVALGGFLQFDLVVLNGGATGFGVRISSTVGLLIVSVVEVHRADSGLNERDLILTQVVFCV